MPVNYNSLDAGVNKRLQALQDLPGRTDGIIDIGRRMRGGNEASFKLRGSQVNAGLKHAVKKLLEALPVTLHGIRQIVNGFAGKIAAEHRSACV